MCTCVYECIYVRGYLYDTGQPSCVCTPRGWEHGGLYADCTLFRRVLKKCCLFIDRLYSSQACTENILFLLTCCILLRRGLKIYSFLYWPFVLFSGVYWKYIGFIDQLYQSHILFIDRLYSSQYWTCIVLNWLIVSIPDLLNSYCLFIERLYNIQECT